MMTRTFYPVGQGAFYVEEFDDKKIYIYDCGTLPHVNIIENIIYNNFRKNQEIEAIFISHLDADHVNGLQCLLTHCRVKKVYLPYLTQEEKVLIYASYFCIQDNESFITRLIENAPLAVRDLNPQAETRITFVMPDHEIINDDFPRDSDYYQTVNSGDEIIVSDSNNEYANWVYVPFNFKNKKRTEDFRKKLIKEGINHEKIKNINIFKTNWANQLYREKLTNVYRTISGGINSNSLVVFSGTKNKTFYKCCFEHNKFVKYCCLHCCQHCGFINKSGCLYLGDYDASGKSKWDELIKKSKISKYLDNIGIIQVPHHGSICSYNFKMSDFESIFFISAKKKNRYRHPSKEVILDILLKKRRLYIVNEDWNSIVKFKLM